MRDMVLVVWMGEGVLAGSRVAVRGRSLRVPDLPQDGLLELAPSNRHPSPTRLAMLQSDQLFHVQNLFAQGPSPGLPAISCSL